MANDNATKEKEILDQDEFDFDELEKQLQEELEDKFSDLEFLDEQQAQIGSPDALGEIILNTVWEQFTNQIAVQAGEDFIKDNNGLHLDLRDEAHIQTTENFAEGKIATHNTEIDYQGRYDEWQSNFVKDENGKTVTHKTRTGKDEATLVKGARNKYDKDRPKGSTDKHTDMDHTVSAGEIIRDPEAAAHMTDDEKIAFANSEANLNEMDSSWNRSKGDKSMDEWLDEPNSKGQKPREIFDMTEDDEAALKKKDQEAREEYEKQKEEAEKRSIEAGKRSQKAEAFRVGKKAARAVIMNLLAELVKKIIQKLVLWLKSVEKNIKSLISSIKDAIVDFVTELKTKVISVVDTAVTVIATSIIGPVVSTIKRAWMFIKQGWKSLKDSVDYIRNPQNKNKPISILMMEVGKIVIAGLTGAGAIGLGEVIEKGLSSIPVFAVEIPLFGSLANIIGIFMGAVISGIIGALTINLINSLIAKKQKAELEKDKVDKKNDILATQEAMISNEIDRTNAKKNSARSSILQRHEEAGDMIRDSMETIIENAESDYEDIDNSENLAEISYRIQKLEEENKNEV
ncbi:hypothetical protein ACQRAL_11695 [Lachnospiraceae bacterium SGI.231]